MNKDFLQETFYFLRFILLWRPMLALYQNYFSSSYQSSPDWYFLIFPNGQELRFL